MGDTTNVTGTSQVAITWPELARALRRMLVYASEPLSDITDEQLEHLESLIVDARKRLKEKSGAS